MEMRIGIKAATMQLFLIIILLSAISQTESASCSVCLSWKIVQTTLILKCKVKVLNDVVAIYRSSKEVGRCYPPYPEEACESDFGELHQNINKSETVFNLDIYKLTQIDGIWTCEQGGKRDSVEVTTSNTKFIPKGSVRAKVRTGSECPVYYMLLSFAGFTGIVISWMGTWLLLVLFYKLDTNLLEFLFPDKFDVLVCSFCNTSLCKYSLLASTVLLCCFVILIPVIIGYGEQTDCPVPGSMVCFGILSGLILITSLYISCFTIIKSQRYGYRQTKIDEPIPEDPEQVLTEEPRLPSGDPGPSGLRSPEDVIVDIRPLSDENGDEITTENLASGDNSANNDTYNAEKDPQGDKVELCDKYEKKKDAEEEKRYDEETVL